MKKKLRINRIILVLLLVIFYAKSSNDDDGPVIVYDSPLTSWQKFKKIGKKAMIPLSLSLVSIYFSIKFKKILPKNLLPLNNKNLLSSIHRFYSLHKRTIFAGFTGFLTGVGIQIGIDYIIKEIEEKKTNQWLIQRQDEGRIKKEMREKNLQTIGYEATMVTKAEIQEQNKKRIENIKLIIKEIEEDIQKENNPGLKKEILDNQNKLPNVIIFKEDPSIVPAIGKLKSTNPLVDRHKKKSDNLLKPIKTFLEAIRANCDENGQVDFSPNSNFSKQTKDYFAVYLEEFRNHSICHRPGSQRSCNGASSCLHDIVLGQNEENNLFKSTSNMISILAGKFTETQFSFYFTTGEKELSFNFADFEKKEKYYNSICFDQKGKIYIGLTDDITLLEN